MTLFQQHLAHDQPVEVIVLNHQRHQFARACGVGRQRWPVWWGPVWWGHFRQGRGRFGQYRQRQGDPEQAAAVLLAVHRQRAAHLVDDPPDDAKAKPGARSAARIGSVQCHEVVEYPLHIGTRYANAGVPDANFGRAGRAGMGHFHRYLAVAGEFDGIADQVQQDLPQLRPITFDHGAAIGRAGEGHVIAICQTGRHLIFDHLTHKVGQIDRPRHEGHLAAVQPGHVQNIVDMVHQKLARRLHDPQVFALVGLQVGRLQQVYGADHAVQRRANLVAHHHQKIGLGLFAGHRLVPRRDQGMLGGQLGGQVAQEGHEQGFLPGGHA